MATPAQYPPRTRRLPPRRGGRRPPVSQVADGPERLAAVRLAEHHTALDAAIVHSLAGHHGEGPVQSVHRSPLASSSAQGRSQGARASSALCAMSSDGSAPGSAASFSRTNGSVKSSAA